MLTDDLSLNLLQFMPHVMEMERNGATFANYFVTDSLCCPSRSSIFTGEFPHNTGVFRNAEPDGGYGAFNAHGNEPNTFAVALQRDGYRTAILGKYLNGYHPGINGPASGWNEWSVAGDGYSGFNYSLNRNGRVTFHRKRRSDYMTDASRGSRSNSSRNRKTLRSSSRLPPSRLTRLIFPLRATRAHSPNWLRRAPRRLMPLRTPMQPDG